jgi:hypothetical protein
MRPASQPTPARSTHVDDDTLTDDQLDNLLDQGKRLEKRVPICTRGDLVAEFERLEDALAQQIEADKTADSLDKGAQARQLAEQIEALREQMRGATIWFTLRALHKDRFRQLIDEHPPRKDEDGEVLAADRSGVNEATFWTPLVRECTVVPAMTPARWGKLDAILSNRQFQALTNAAWNVNRDDVDVPFSRAASRLMRGSASG